MATTRTTSTSGARRRALGILAAAALLALASLAVIATVPGTPAADAAGAAPTAAAYRWPVKPFGQPHPVRANFGDPRTTFDGPPTTATLLAGHGSFSFHFGVDIAVPDGTAVYAVRSGTASFIGGRNVQVDSGDGFKTQYWHIVPAIKAGQHVTAEQTILGRVMKGYEHVHFTELANGRPVNPLAPGHMGPYGESSAPELESVSFRVGDVCARGTRGVRLRSHRAGRASAGSACATRPGCVGQPSGRSRPARLARRAGREPPNRDPAARGPGRPHLDPREPRLLDVLRPRQQAERRDLRRPAGMADAGHVPLPAHALAAGHAPASRTASTGSWSPRPTSAATAAPSSRSSSSGTGRARECQTRGHSDRSSRRPGRPRLHRPGARADRCSTSRRSSPRCIPPPIPPA